MWLGAIENPYIHGSFEPSFAETEGGAEMKVHGTIPKDLAGLYVRNGPNPAMEPQGRYHWFDGDGMVHAIRFEDGRAHYRNRWVKTDALTAEREVGRALGRRGEGFGVQGGLAVRARKQGPRAQRGDAPRRVAATADGAGVVTLACARRRSPVRA